MYIYKYMHIYTYKREVEFVCKRERKRERERESKLSLPTQPPCPILSPSPLTQPPLFLSRRHGLLQLPIITTTQLLLSSLYKCLPTPLPLNPPLHAIFFSSPRDGPVDFLPLKPLRC